MCEYLIPLFCVAEISAETLSSIIETAYAGSPDTPPSIIILCDHALPTNPEATQSPVSDLSSYPFLSHSVKELASFMDSTAESGISSHEYLIADEQTNENHSLIFVARGHEPGQTPQTVRLDAEYANAIPVAVQVATMNIKEVQAQVDEDGVFRGGASRPAVRKGRPAPRKQLG